MKISKNAYYIWIKTNKNKKQKASLIYLKQRIIAIYNDSNQIYGSLRIQKMLEREDLVYSRSYIAFLMKELDLKSVLSKKYRVVTTHSNHNLPIAENRLNRDFYSKELGEKWVSDITYIKVGSK